MAKGLAKHPDDVRVNTVAGEAVIMVELTVAEEDVPRVIGSNGRNIKAMRQILSAASGRKKAVLELVNDHTRGSEE